MDKTPLVLGFAGLKLDAKLTEHLKRVNPYALILFSRNIESKEQLKALIQECQNLLGKVVIAIDHEGGPVNRFNGAFPTPPPPAALRFLSKEQRHQGARVQAGLLRAMGIHLNFAPVLDLEDARSSKVLGLRCLSENPEQVASLGLEILEAHASQGVAVCPKHFPGHGKAGVDTHLNAGNLIIELEQMKTEDLVPFKTLASKAPAMMCAHLRYPALDPAQPATFSKAIIQGLLKDSIGFDGLVISDCLEMKAVSKDYSPQAMAKLGFEAGLDLWMSSFSLKQSFSFQLELAQALKEQWECLSDKDKETRWQRLDLFTKTWVHSAASQAMPDPDQAKALLAQAIIIQREKPLVGHKLFLIQTQSSKELMVNRTETFLPFAQSLAKLCNRIETMVELPEHQPEKALFALEQAKQKGLLPLLILKDSDQNLNLGPLLKPLFASQGQGILLNLGMPWDLGFEVVNHWALAGSGKAALEPLASKIEALFKP